MALSDCEKCWETPCVCGHKYRKYSKERLLEFIEGILSKNPNKEEVLKLLTKQNK